VSVENLTGNRVEKRPVRLTKRGESAVVSAEGL